MDLEYFIKNKNTISSIHNKLIKFQKELNQKSDLNLIEFFAILSILPIGFGGAYFSFETLSYLDFSFHFGSFIMFFILWAFYSFSAAWLLSRPLIKLFKPITPSFIIGPLVPLYVAWFFYMIRFYLMPWILGYSVMGMLSFPLESEISRQIYQFFNSFKF